MKPFFFSALAMLSTACEPDPGQPYSPCTEASDCDPLVTDGCHHDVDGTGTCTLICRQDSDCPAGPPGSSPPVCEPYKQTRVCSLP